MWPETLPCVSFVCVMNYAREKPPLNQCHFEGKADSGWGDGTMDIGGTDRKGFLLWDFGR